MSEEYRIKNDPFCKIIFKSGRKEIIHLINYIYKTDYKLEEVEIEFLDKEFQWFDKSKQTLAKREVDYFISITHGNLEDKIKKFRVEFQTIYDDSMPYRSLIYDLMSAQKELCQSVLKLTKPTSVVIYPVEFRVKNEVNTLHLYDEFGNLEFEYKMKVLKIWELEEKELDQYRLEMLYPLKMLDVKTKLVNKQISMDEYSVLIEHYMKKYTELFKDRIQKEGDVMMAAEALAQVVVEENNREFREYIHNTYFKPYIDRNNQARAEGRAEGISQGIVQRNFEIARNMKRKGFSLEEIMEMTDLGRKDLEGL